MLPSLWVIVVSSLHVVQLQRMLCKLVWYADYNLIYFLPTQLKVTQWILLAVILEPKPPIVGLPSTLLPQWYTFCNIIPNQSYPSMWISWPSVYDQWFTIKFNYGTSTLPDACGLVVVSRAHSCKCYCWVTFEHKFFDANTDNLEKSYVPGLVWIAMPHAGN
jgi:hypothetical protein